MNFKFGLWVALGGPKKPIEFGFEMSRFKVEMAKTMEILSAR